MEANRCGKEKLLSRPAVIDHLSWYFSLHQFHIDASTGQSRHWAHLQSTVRFTNSDCGHRCRCRDCIFRLCRRRCLGTAPVQFELVQAPPEVIIRLWKLPVASGLGNQTSPSPTWGHHQTAAEDQDICRCRVCPQDIKSRGEETEENDCLYWFSDLDPILALPLHKITWSFDWCQLWHLKTCRCCWC